ncbi:MAG: PVC-type heme-binding CxxCH protein, partial [Planctomycetota bacterium]
CVLGNQVIVSASPTIWRFTDEDGDDVPDSKVALFTETGDPQHDHSAHSFLFGPDGKLLWNFGNTGRQVKDADGELVIDIHGRSIVDDGQPFYGGMPFRCDLDGSHFEVLAHNFRNNWETTIDSFGTLWQSDNDDDGNRGTRINYVMQHGNYGYRDELTGAGWRDSRITMEETIPERHWHLNDPGVVPNLLQTGAGSPSGICFYEGSLLPERFHNQMIHAEPGANVVRAYPVRPDGAGYTASIEPIITGVDDPWFRPADVCVAPDGSLFVTDWYDPGVGGHRQGDSDRGRLFRVAPPGTPYRTPSFDFSTPSGCVSALENPNLSVRFMAWQGLQRLGAEAIDDLWTMTRHENPRFRARAFWVLGKMDGLGSEVVATAMGQADPDLRVMAIRLATQLSMSAADVCGDLATDPSAAVRRELALALRFDQSDQMPFVWATLAAQHDGRDRWYLEALGIGSDLRSDACFDAWMSRVDGQWNTPAGHDIVWRVRSDAAAEKLVELIADPATTIDQTNRYFRSLEYHDDDVRSEALMRLIRNAGMASTRSQAVNDAVTVRAIERSDSLNLAKYPDAELAVARHIDRRVGKKDFMELVRRFNPRGIEPSLQATLIDQRDDTLSLRALAMLLRRDTGSSGIGHLIRNRDLQEASRIIRLLGVTGSSAALVLLNEIVTDSKLSYPLRSASVKALASSNVGASKLLDLAETERLAADLRLLAGGLLIKSEDNAVIARANQALPLPKAVDRVPLAPLDELVQMTGDISHGAELFRTTATCGNCHLVHGQGKEVGPDLTEIGSKLSRESMFTAILAPSAGISHNYENHIALLESGRIINGLLISQTEDRVILRSADAIDMEIERDEILEMKKSEKSIMPENLHHTTDQQGLVDLVEYLMTLKKNEA